MPRSCASTDARGELLGDAARGLEIAGACARHRPHLPRGGNAGRGGRGLRAHGGLPRGSASSSAARSASSRRCSTAPRVLFCELELARSAVLRALRAIDEPHTALAPFASLAKARAGDAATLAVNEAVQLHGGIGMTDEFEIGFFMKRAAALAADLRRQLLPHRPLRRAQRLLSAANGTHRSRARPWTSASARGCDPSSTR